MIATRNFDSTPIKITVKQVGTVEAKSLKFVSLLNIILKRCMKNCGFVEFGKNREYFDFKAADKLHSANIMVLSGYKAHINCFAERFLLTTELAHKLMNSETVLDTIKNIIQRNSDNFKTEIHNQLIGRTVITNFNKKTYKITDILWDETPTCTFETKATRLAPAGTTSFVDYYLTKYNIRIRDSRQFLLQSIVKKKVQSREETGGNSVKVVEDIVKLVPELCSLTGPGLMNPNDFGMKKDLDALTKLRPQPRFDKLTQFLEKIKMEPKSREDFSKWNVHLADGLLALSGTRLATEPVFFKNDVKEEETDGGWDQKLRSAEHLEAVRLDKWVLLYTGRDERNATNFQRELVTLSAPMGFAVSSGELMRLSDRSPALEFTNALRRVLGSHSPPQMVVCLVPNNNKDTYDSIKKVCCLEFGVPSQVVTSRLLGDQRKARSAITKIAVQMNCKLGGEIWAVRIPFRSFMVVGIDLWKDSVTKKRVCAFVSSTNSNREKLNCTRYFSRCSLENPGSDYVTCLEIFMKDALYKFRQVNQTLPTQIYIYRDGVSDGQFDAVSNCEIPQIQNAFASFEDYSPSFQFVIVKKRTNTKFFMKEGHLINNAPIATVVNTDVVTEQGKEFYLVSQRSNMTTVSPTHFHILTEPNAEKDELRRIQVMSYKLTHLYYNWAGQIRVPAPCHYAFKLARLVGDSLHNTHSPNLDDKLFYL